jgi:hypothetical protein
MARYMALRTRVVDPRFGGGRSCALRASIREGRNQGVSDSGRSKGTLVHEAAPPQGKIFIVWKIVGYDHALAIHR